MSKENIYQITNTKLSLLERFGLYYLNFFKRIDNDKNVFNYTDEQLTNKVNKITLKGILLSCIVGIACVFTTVWVDVYFAEKSFLVHY